MCCITEGISSKSTHENCISAPMQNQFGTGKSCGKLTRKKQVKNLSQVSKNACLKIIFRKHLIYERSKLRRNCPLLPKCKLSENMLTYEKALNRKIAK